MKIFTGFFDNLHFTESLFGDAVLEEDKLIIPVKNVLLMSGHPLIPYGLIGYGGEMIFDGVLNSHCNIREYIGDSCNPIGSKEPRHVIHKSSSDKIFKDESLTTFTFEGFQETTNAWVIDWVVLAKLFRFKVNI